MTAGEALLRECRQLGIKLLVRGDKLRAEAPPGRLTENLSMRIGSHKAELLRLLAASAPEPLNGPAVEALAQARGLRRAYVGAAFEMAETLGFPRLPYKPALTIGAGEATWRCFLASGSAGVPVLRDCVLPALRDVLAEIPAPGPRA